MKPKYSIWIIAAAVCCLFAMITVNLVDRSVEPDTNAVNNGAPAPTAMVFEKPDRSSPTLLTGRSLYADQSRTVVSQTEALQSAGRSEDARLLQTVASQPGTTWLTGPTEGDQVAQRDIDAVARTSAEAASRGQVAVYQLYAIPQRDACAEYSKGGFETKEQYLGWIDRIVAALKGQAIFSVEADAIAHTVIGNCLSQTETTNRYDLLKTTVDKLNTSNYVLGVYLDAGHPEWITDPARIVGPLKASGANAARGVAVNVSNFVATPTVVSWAERLTAQLGSGKKAIIDTSRNGRGTPPASVTGDARWCNPAGRGIGERPTTTGLSAAIDAYIWIKNVGESDGDCRGNPAAGTFSTELALELARNSL